MLDLGSGRGAVLLAATRQLPNGKAVGVDLWRNSDQSGNTAERTLANARTLGVADTVELHTADLTALPFQDATVAVVLSSLAIHNIDDPARRVDDPDQDLLTPTRTFNPSPTVPDEPSVSSA